MLRDRAPSAQAGTIILEEPFLLGVCKYAHISVQMRRGTRRFDRSGFCHSHRLPRLTWISTSMRHPERHPTMFEGVHSASGSGLVLPSMCAVTGVAWGEKGGFNLGLLSRILVAEEDIRFLARGRCSMARLELGCWKE